MDTAPVRRPAPSRRARGRTAPALLLVVVSALGLSAAAAGATPPEPGTAMRGERYCELLLLTPAEGRLEAQVWSTYGLNDCPEPTWSALDPATVAREAGVAVVVRNGPRYWLVDRARRATSTPPTVRDLGGLAMRQLGAVSLAPADLAAGAYRPQRVVRSTTMTWRAGTRVFELTAPDGAVYVMQSWSRQVDDTLTAGALRRLGRRLDLPEGWRFTTRVLERPIRVGTDADGAAVVLQDDLMNSYSRRR